MTKTNKQDQEDNQNDSLNNLQKAFRELGLILSKIDMGRAGIAIDCHSIQYNLTRREKMRDMIKYKLAKYRKSKPKWKMMWRLDNPEKVKHYRKRWRVLMRKRHQKNRELFRKYNDLARKRYYLEQNKLFRRRKDEK